MNDLNMNRLPVATWNQCGVNSAPKAAALPELSGNFWGEVNFAYILPAGVGEAESDFSAFAESGMGAETDAYIAENATVRHALTVAEGVSVAEPVILEVTLDAAHPTALTSLSVDAKAGSSLTIVQVLRGDAEHGAAASLTRIRAGENAQVRLVQIQLLGDNARRWNTAAVEEGRNARVEQVRIELGGILSACGTRAALSAAKSEYDLDAVYFGSGSALLDYNDVSVHTAKDTMCEMHTAGVLTGHADKILRGTIDFRRGAKRGVGHESEDVLLFSTDARNRTAPLILCGEEEVEGQHAASIGRLDEEKLYYLRSRGLSEAQARRLMVDARFAPALDKIPLETLRDEVRAEAARRLDNDAE